VTATTEATDPYHMSTPKLDIAGGLARTTSVQLHQRWLVDHQASSSVLGDLHVAKMSIRFLFLVLEAKGLSLSGSLVSGRIQAAISGACMLTVLKDRSHQVG
jgi:hypothetical protein